MSKDKDKIVYIQGVCTQSELDDLKRISGTDSTKEAIAYAIERVIENRELKRQVKQ